MTKRVLSFVIAVTLVFSMVAGFAPVSAAVVVDVGDFMALDYAVDDAGTTPEDVPFHEHVEPFDTSRIQVFARGDFSQAIDADGNLWAWGNEANEW